MQNYVDKQIEILRQFEGLSIESIASIIKLNPEILNSKSYTVKLANEMLNFTDFDRTIFNNQNPHYHLSIKSVRLSEDGKPKEAISLEQIDFMEVYREDWQNSWLRKKLNTTKYLFLVFQYKKVNRSEETLFFKGAKFWGLPLSELDLEVKSFWGKLQNVLVEGVKLETVKSGKKYIVKNDLPKTRDNRILHVRPKAKDGNDKVQLPDGQFITRQAYWFNGSYIFNVLRDIGDLNLSYINEKNSPESFSSTEIESIKSDLTKEVYTFQEFVDIVAKTVPQFTELDIKTSFMDKLSYKIEAPVILSNNYNTVNEYLEKYIFDGNYFTVPDEPFYKLPNFLRKIDNLEKGLKLLKVENGMYITNKNLDNNDISINSLLDYIREVEKFVKEDSFFTLKSLKGNGFKHPLEDFGFEEIFFESILKHPSSIKSMRLKGESIFIKSTSKPDIKKFIEYIIDNKNSIKIYDLIDLIDSKVNIQMEESELIKVMKNTGYYYSSELMKIYRNKNFFYEEVYGSRGGK